MCCNPEPSSGRDSRVTAPLSLCGQTATPVILHMHYTKVSVCDSCVTNSLPGRVSTGRQDDRNVGAVRGCSCSASQHCKRVRCTLIQTGGEQLFARVAVRRCVQPSFPQHCRARWSEKLQSELFSVGQNKPHQLGRKTRPRWLGLNHKINRKQLRLLPASCAVSVEIWSAILNSGQQKVRPVSFQIYFWGGLPFESFFFFFFVRSRGFLKYSI